MLSNYNFLNPVIFKKIKGFIEKANAICIIPHVDPDPDALGSAYSLALMLKKIGKTVNVLLNHKGSEGLYSSYEKEFAFYNIYDEDQYDLFISVDSGNVGRLGKFADFFQTYPKILLINLDHHIDNSFFGQVNLADSRYSSTGEIIAELAVYMNWPMDTNIASLIYSAILSDTGSFRFSSTTFRTHYLVAYLLNYSIDTNYIYENLFENFTLEYLKVRQKVIDNITLFLNDKFAVTVLKREFYQQEYHFSNFVRIGLSLKGVEISLHFIEKEEELVKVSLRSKGKVNVNKIASHFGGGGHIQASGFSLNYSYDIARKKVLDYVLPIIKEELKSNIPL